MFCLVSFLGDASIVQPQQHSSSSSSSHKLDIVLGVGLSVAAIVVAAFVVHRVKKIRRTRAERADDHYVQLS